MTEPPLGITLPATWIPERDGDTPVVRLPSGRRCAIRLKDCWCPEKHQPGGIEARNYLWKILGHAVRLTAHFDLPKDRNADGVLDITEILGAASFDRIPGRLFADGQDVSELMVSAGHATKTEQR